MGKESNNFQRIILFYDYNCIEKKVTDVTPYEGLPNVAINPDTAELEKRRVKRQHWKIHDGEVIEKTDEEKKIVDEWHSKNVQVNPAIVEVNRIKFVEKTPFWNWVAIASLSLVEILTIFVMRG